MLDDTRPEAIIAALEQIIASGALSAASSQQAERLLQRLRTGVRVLVLGPHGVGKTQLCSVLLGQILPQGATGGFQVYRHASANAESDIVLDHPLLQTLTLTDMTSRAGEPLDAGLADAMDQADVVLWCTQEFSEQESQIWMGASEHLKDHSFLVLTKADQNAASGDLSRRINALQSVAAEEFHSFFPTSTFHAVQALQNTGAVSASQLAASGVAGLSQTLSNTAISGQRADLDNTLLFLQRHRRTGAQPVETVPARDPEYASYEKALAMLKSRTPEMIKAGEDIDSLEPETFLACCSTLAADLVALAADEPHTAPEFDSWRDDLFEASDKVILMSLECDLRSAADAATIILQLKQDLESRMDH